MTRGGDAQINYLDLGDIESLASVPTRLDVYKSPDDKTAGLMARSLRDYGSSLLRGDLSLIPQLEQRIEERKEDIRPKCRIGATNRILAAASEVRDMRVQGL
jgi:hypothetical protein